ncbi:MAG: hypothetical protein IT176_08060 [Acidobacteria bacterium]|nr:hypothetical protein [Acidobacteriota bacterium]
MDARRDLPWDVVGIGENSVDEVLLVRAMPSSGGKAEMVARHVVCGGQTATAMYACARLGLRAKYAGATGADDNGRLIRRELAGLGVDLAHVVERDAPSRRAVILVEESTGERAVIWRRDPRLDLQMAELPLADLTRTRVVHVDQTDPVAALGAARAARDAGALVTTDIDHVMPCTRGLTELATHAIFAEPAAKALAGDDNLERALRAIAGGTRATLVATCGTRGAVALAQGCCVSVPAYQVRAVDTTGAGDVFRAGFIYALVKEEPIDRALRVANAAAAISCTRVGAMNGAPSLEELSGLLER